MDFASPLQNRLQSTSVGQPGYQAVNNFSSGKTQMPQELMKNIANARALMQSRNMNQQDTLKQMQPGFKGMTPEALTALQALMSRGMGQSSFPGADTNLRQAVDTAYNPQ